MEYFSMILHYYTPIFTPYTHFHKQHPNVNLTQKHPLLKQKNIFAVEQLSK